MTAVFEVLQPGVLATVQDLGRAGFQRHGVGTAGAMDPFALQVGNLLVGNARGSAALEIGLGGLRLRALEDRIVSIAGADLGAGLPLWKSLKVRKGEEVHFKAPVRGAWAYLALAGGLEAEPVMGSRSTDLRARIGKPVAKGDLLRAGAPGRSSRDGRMLIPGELPQYGDETIVRVVTGPEDFSEDALKTFLSAPYEVTAQSNRMGYRLRGPALATPSDIVSDGVAAGTVQVPSDGQPIVLMADRQTTGGYARIATVISRDLSAMSQSRPGTKVTFRAVSIDEAQDLAVEAEKSLSTIQSGCGVG